MTQSWTRQIGATSSRDDSPDLSSQFSRGNQSGTSSCACAKVARAQVTCLRLSSEPLSRADQSPGKQVDIETKFASVIVDFFFFACEQIKKQSSNARVPNHASDVLVPGAVATAATSVGEQYDSSRVLWHAQLASK